MSTFTGPPKGRTIEHVLTESQIMKGGASSPSGNHPELPSIRDRHSRVNGSVDFESPGVVMAKQR
jgi:hypothetical protein